MTWIVVFVLILLIVAVPFYLERQKSRPSEQERRDSGYLFAGLSQGKIAYKWHGAARGPVIVAVHGLTTPSQVWDDLIPMLTALGYRVVTYDLYGRGLSDAPEGRQNAAFFQRQLGELLSYLELDNDVTLMGYSMGGSIVTGYSASNQHQLQRVILIASAGIEITETRFEKVTRLLPGIGDWLSLYFLGRKLRNEIDVSSHAHPIESVKLQQLDRRGYVPAVTSSRRFQLVDQQQSEHRILMQENVSTFAIWAENDQIIPIRCVGLLSQWNREARQEVIDSAGHDLLQTHPKEVAAAIARLATV